MPSTPDIASVLSWQPAGSGRTAISVVDLPRPRLLGTSGADEPEAGASKRRTQMRDLHHSLHCSIVGTCLTTGELRRLLLHLNMKSAATKDDHGVHQIGVLLASGPSIGSKQLQKALDRKHRLAINQFARAKDAATVERLWDEALGAGDIPGAYWSVLTHPATTEALVKRVFGEVHMLSHLVGAANRADIQRLRKLEDENSALADQVARQQQQLRDGFTARDETIRRLSDALARRAAEPATQAPAGASDENTALAAVLAERERRLARETARRERLEERLAAVMTERGAAARAGEQAAFERDALQAELASVEVKIAKLLPDQDDGCAPELHGLTLLYVGGRAHQIPQLKGLVELAGGQLLHHDGGLEHNPTLLPGLVSRADLIVFPVDCVSHDAMASLKRSCRQLGKRFVPLRTSSLTSLLAGITTIDAGSAPN